MILDTNALSDAAEKNPAIIQILSAVPQLAIPVIALGEYSAGIARSRHAAYYREWLDTLLADSLVLDITDTTTHHYAAIILELRQIGRPIPTNDIWIAALCRQHNFPLLSRDRHFDVVPGVQRVEW
ncbi:MAG TPA: type II toxin-antitoxin system VapC family toxin [Candidatus Acidoferrum sp.]